MKLVLKAGPRDGLYEITPSDAQKVLDSRAKNRPLSESRAQRLSRAISNGEWVTNGETLIFDDKGSLMDGQHRMRAVVLANRPIVSYCVFSAWSKRAFDTIDIGKVRKASDLLALDGYKYYSMAAAVTKLLMAYEWMLDSGSRSLTMAISGHGPSATAIKRSYEKHKDAISAACQKVIELNSLRGIVAPSTGAFVFMMAAKVDPKKADTFVEGLATGENLRRESPIWMCRERLRTGGRRGFPMDVKLAFLVKSWNAFRSGRTVSSLKFSEGESFPHFSD